MLNGPEFVASPTANSKLNNLIAAPDMLSVVTHDIGSSASRSTNRMAMGTITEQELIRQVAKQLNF